MIGLVEASIDSIRMSLTSQQRIIILKDVKDERYLPIWIGPYESESISIALQEIEISRPQTHDLIKKAIRELGGVIERIIIQELKDDIFYGVIEIMQDKKKILIDARPSDALALAVRTHVPIFISEEIMQAASIVPVEEEYISANNEIFAQQESIEESPANISFEEVGPDRLSIFEEFLQKIPGDDQDNPELFAEDDDDTEDNDDDGDDQIDDDDMRMI